MEEEHLALSATQSVCPICAERLFVEGQFGHLVHFKCPHFGWTWVGEPRAGHAPLSLSSDTSALTVAPLRTATHTLHNLPKEATGRCAS